LFPFVSKSNGPKKAVLEHDWNNIFTYQLNTPAELVGRSMLLILFLFVSQTQKYEEKPGQTRRVRYLFLPIR
jgi:hypothetical protein